MVDGCTALLLAGGQSRRFGTDKASALIDGTPMIGRVFAAVRPVCTEVLVSVGAEDRPLPVPKGLPHLLDRHRDIGPLGGLHVGLHAAKKPWLLAVACDLPFLTSNALRVLLAARSEEADAIVARDGDGRLHPLCSAYRCAPLRSAVDEQILAGRFALYALLDRLSVVPVDLPDSVLRNVNRPEDVAS